MIQQEFIKVEKDVPRQKIIDALLSKDTSVTISEDSLDNEMILNMGPQHPATHGVLRVLLRLDGEMVVSSECELGYLHRGYEKLAENMTFHEYIPHTVSLDYLSSLANTVAYCMAVQNFMHVELLIRAQIIRSIVGRLPRISSTFLAAGPRGLDLAQLAVMVRPVVVREQLFYV